MPQLLIIFDLDGTLVDSEALCNQAFLDLLPLLTDTVQELIEQFRGRKLADILAEIERKLSAPLPERFEHRYRQRVTELFATELKPVYGVPEMLAAIEHPFCIASSGPPEKIGHALAIAGLASHFGTRYFSSYVVGSWKPDPGLFLHAATAMGFPPGNCVVVEDSPVGLEAAVAADMQALHYVPGAQSPGAGRFSSMLELPSILRSLEERMCSNKPLRAHP